MSTIAFPLQDIVDVVVLVQPQAPRFPRSTSAASSAQRRNPASERARVYSSNALAANACRGFPQYPEYIAAQIYFSH